MIIIEGMDNSGKTTLIETLIRTFGDQVDVIKPPGPFKDQEELEGWMREDMKKLQNYSFQKPTIYDRYTYFSEPIYGPIIRDQNMLSDELHEEFEELLLMPDSLQPVIVIYCRPPLDCIYDFGEREQMEGVIEYRKQLLHGYDTMMGEFSQKAYNSGQSRTLVVPYDWTNPVAEKSILQVVRHHIQQHNLNKIIQGPTNNFDIKYGSISNRIDKPNFR